MLQTSFLKIFALMFFFFFWNEPQGNSTHEWFCDCHNDRWVTRMKNCISGVCLRYIWSSFILPPFVSTLVLYSSSMWVFSFSHHFPYSSLLFTVLLLYSLPIHRFSSPVALSLYASYSSTLLSCLLIPPAFFCPCLSKTALITWCCCITVTIMQIYLLFNVLKKCSLCQGQNKSPLGRISEDRETHEQIYWIIQLCLCNCNTFKSQI